MIRHEKTMPDNPPTLNNNWKEVATPNFGNALEHWWAISQLRCGQQDEKQERNKKKKNRKNNNENLIVGDNWEAIASSAYLIEDADWTDTDDFENFTCTKMWIIRSKRNRLHAREEIDHPMTHVSNMQLRGASSECFALAPPYRFKNGYSLALRIIPIMFMWWRAGRTSLHTSSFAPPDGSKSSCL